MAPVPYNRVSMASARHLAILKQGVKVWNAWRERARSTKPNLVGLNANHTDLAGVNFSRCDLSGAFLYESNLHKSDLSNAKLKNAQLHEANLNRAHAEGADFRGADLSRSILTRTNLNNADLRKSGLWGAFFNGASVKRAKLNGAIVGETVFAGCDLAEALGLDSIEFTSASYLDVPTFFKLYGKVPDKVLQGIGIPEPLMTYAASLIASGHPIHFYSCFISYSTKDQEFANRLHADLQANGVRCWFARHDVQAGKKLHEQIDEAIRVYDRLLLILSSASMKSEWVNTEIAKARNKELREGRRVLFPIRLCSFEALRDWECFDADAGKDSACEIREYFIPDFTKWKDHDSYQAAFRDLLRDLKAEDDGTPGSSSIIRSGPLRSSAHA
jgi:uncharacterized protein YjbI with pentapeptide repeats